MSLLAALPIAAGAQQLQPELRVDAVHTDVIAWHAGGGITWPLGNYVRVSTIASRRVAGDVAPGDDWRADLLARVSLDPFRRRSLGFSFGGGLTIRRRPYVLAVAELEGPIRGGATLAAQVGLGGGLRLGLVVRRGMRGRR